MELEGEEVSQRGRRGPHFYSGGNNPTVAPPTSPAEAGSTAKGGGTTAEPAVPPLQLAVLPRRGEQQGLGPRAVLPQW